MAITSTAETIQKLAIFKAEIDKKNKSEIVTFNVEDIDISREHMYVNGTMLSEASTKRVLSHLRVKNNFLALSDNMTPTDWTNVREALKKPTATQVVHGRKVSAFVNDATQDVIDDVHMAAPKTTGLLERDQVLNLVIDSIVSTGKDISLKSTMYLDEKDEIVLTLVENDVTLDIFSNEVELWKIGKRIVFNAMNFSIFAYYERVECGSGMAVPKYGFRANISNNKFNIEKIKQALEKEITLNSQDLDANLIDSLNHLNSRNISVREFSRFRNFFNSVQHSAILEKWFNDSKMNLAYGCIATEMSGLWQTTADSGINALTFLKTLIYTSSFPEEATPEPKGAEVVEEVKLSDKEKYDLEIKASELLLKKELDLETVAPKPTWK
jgi:hypothetical protein